MVIVLGLAAGLLVRVRGELSVGSRGMRVASASTLSSIANGPGQGDAEIEGYISALTADGFLLGTHRVVVTAGTRFEDGTAADLQVGTKVEVEGPVADGVQTALKIELKAGVRIEADVLTVVGDRVTLAGLPGIELQVTAQIADRDHRKSGTHQRVVGVVPFGPLGVEPDASVDGKVG